MIMSKGVLGIQLPMHNIPGNFFTNLQIVHNCIFFKNFLSQGKKIHSFLSHRRSAFVTGPTFHNNLINMYAKCGNLIDARKVFDHMKEQDSVTWNTIIVAYRRHGYPHEALTLFYQMRRMGFQPDHFTFAIVLAACAKLGDLDRGMDIHQSIKDRGITLNVVVETALVDMYAKCGSMHKASELFDKMPKRDVFTWNAMIVGYAQNGFVDKALEAFQQMRLAGVKPDSTTFASVLPACAKMRALELGMDIHQSLQDREILSDVVLATALVDMYAKCGNVDKARELFDKMPQRNLVSWNAMIGGYVQMGHAEKASDTFKQMQLAGVMPDSTTFASILPACAKMGALEQGMDIHQNILDRGILSDILATALVDMYAKCGSTDKAQEVFDKMSQRHVVSWNALIAGYAQNGFVGKALEAYEQMQLTGVIPDSTTFATILPACAKMGALEQGMDIHQSIKDRGISTDVILATALLDMYAKCGSIHKARELFDKMPQRNLVSWNAMIVGYAQNGFCKDALKIFELMQHSGIYPNVVTLACVLRACSVAGLVAEGCTYFSHMNYPYGITPTIDHYECIVDLLARAGYLQETLNFIIKMPVKPGVDVWICVLGGCKLHMNIGLGVFTAILLFDLDPENSAAYVLLSNIYAEVGRWSEVQMVRRLMKDRGVKKIPGCSWIEGHKMVHAFCVGDKSQTKGT